MIHIFVGTKAQFVKMAPIMWELDKRRVDYNLIDSGQHGELAGRLVKEFGLKKPNIYLRKEHDNINTLLKAFTWSLENIQTVLLKKDMVWNDVFNRKQGVCLIHGDTLSTLLSLAYAKRCRIKVAHIEAGLRSYNMFSPFPEEIIRMICMRMSDILFAPSGWAYENLDKMGFEHKTINVKDNTIKDTIRYALSKSEGSEIEKDPYVLVTIHRVETLYSFERMKGVVDLLSRISNQLRVIFVTHEPTQKRLEHYGLDKRIRENRGIKVMPLQPYLLFLGMINNADYVVTDGGSIQEECAYLDKPCLIARDRTERMDGLGANAVIWDFDGGRLEKFFSLVNKETEKADITDYSPSKEIVDRLIENGFHR